MGVKFLTHNHEKCNARLPFKLTFNSTCSKLETDCNYEKYQNMGRGILKSIGIDGSVFLHSYFASEYPKQKNFGSLRKNGQVDYPGFGIENNKFENENNNNNNNNYKVFRNNAFIDLDLSARCVARNILETVNVILSYFEIFNPSENSFRNFTGKSSKIILHLVVDGAPPIKKNRPYRAWCDRDAYSTLSRNDKRKLHTQLHYKIEETLKENYKYHGIRLLSNLLDEHRNEGEIALYSFCQKVNKKFNHDPNIRNVIVSSDSDVVAMMIFHQDKTLVVVSKINSQIYILNHDTIGSGLNMTDMELKLYTMLHFIFFGSDYNLGLVTNPNESKQRIIQLSVKSQMTDLNAIANQFARRLPAGSGVKKKNSNPLLSSPLLSSPLLSSSDSFSFSSKGECLDLEQFKICLIIEAMCAAKYYHSLGDEKFLQMSPKLHTVDNINWRAFIPFLKFK